MPPKTKKTDNKKQNNYPKKSELPNHSYGEIIREWVDTLVFAFLLAMFIRTFVVELFKIPSGSMTPTLIGDEIYEYDMDGNGEDDLIVRSKNRQFVDSFPVFLKNNGVYDDRKVFSRRQKDFTKAKIKGGRYDRICVNKLAYLFQGPDRGDIAVFKTPIQIFDSERPIYVKRVCALPGETVDFVDDGVEKDGLRLSINGKIVEEPEIYKHRRYIKRAPGMYNKWMSDAPKKVPDNEYLMFGDNSWNSSDSRSWGSVPSINYKGKAFLRYWPLTKSGKWSNFGLLEQTLPIVRWVLFFVYLGIAYLLSHFYSKFDEKWKNRLSNEPVT